jgi:hypothetical protein
LGRFSLIVQCELFSFLNTLLWLKYRTAIKVIFLYFNLCSSAMLDGLSCSLHPYNFLIRRRNHFLLRRRNHFLLRWRNHFLLRWRNHFLLRRRNHFLTKDFLLRRRNHFLLGLIQLYFFSVLIRRRCHHRQDSLEKEGKPMAFILVNPA